MQKIQLNHKKTSFYPSQQAKSSIANKTTPLVNNFLTVILMFWAFSTNFHPSKHLLGVLFHQKTIENRCIYSITPLIFLCKIIFNLKKVPIYDRQSAKSTYFYPNFRTFLTILPRETFAKIDKFFNGERRVYTWRSKFQFWAKKIINLHGQRWKIMNFL